VNPFFIVGFQRSGTTLLRVMLDAHPDLAVPLDTVGLWDRYEALLPQYDNLRSEKGRARIISDLIEEDRIKLWKVAITDEDIQARWNDLTYSGLIDAFYRTYAERMGKRIWGDKDPGNMTRIDQLNRWFPKCHIIHIIRDGRDACLSHLRQDFGFDNLLDCATAWREEVQWVRRIGVLLGNRYLEVRYEDLVASPQEQLTKVCAFLNIAFDPAMLTYYQSVERSIPAEKRHIWQLIGEPPASDNVERWRRNMTSSQRICFEKRASSVLKEAGYEVLPSASGAYLEELRNLGTSAWGALRRKLKGN
jgi:hypothetical protein